MCVKWNKSEKTGEYQFDEQQCVFEIELVRNNQLYQLEHFVCH